MLSNNTPTIGWGYVFPIIGLGCKPVDEESHSLLLTDATDTSITVQWYSEDEGSTYNVRLTSADGSVDTIVVTTDSIYTFNGLPTNTRYNVQVRKQCYFATQAYDTTVYSPWTSSTSFLLGSEECLPVSNLQVIPLTHMASVTWGYCSCYGSVQLLYGPRNLPESMWTTVDVPSPATNYFITGLDPNQHYGVKARGVCNRINRMSEWSEQVNFSTATDDSTTTGIASIGGVDFAVSPNPVHGVVEVTLPQPLESDGVLSLYDLGGREMRHMTLPAGSRGVTLDTEGCAAGVYFLKLTTPQGVATRRLLVE